MTLELEERCKSLVEELGLGSGENVTKVIPLTGGVASDIAMIELGGRRVCVKFALPKLKVKEDWQVPVRRNTAEYEWLKVAASISADNAVNLLGCSEKEHGFAMEFLDGDGVRLWKASLLAEKDDRGEAALVGDIIGRIHAASTRSGFNMDPFENQNDFRAIRIEPYLTFTAGRHREVKDEINGLADMLYASRQVLVHGDVSPKNIMFRDGYPILLDAECATIGDACFDPTFCLNHLVLKAIHLPKTRDALLNSVLKFWNAYSEHVSWENKDVLEARICALLPALMLGRIDGKSPVEYLDENEKNVVRDISLPLIKFPVSTLPDFIDHIGRRLKEMNA